MIRDLKNPSLRIAKRALRFFALPADDQMMIWRNHGVGPVPNFFEEDDAASPESNYFLGIACVFTTYKGALFDEADGDQACEALQDFSHRLAVAMHNAAREWTGSAVMQSDTWQSLRHDASRALDELGITIHEPAGTLEFDIDRLIDPDEFRTTQSAKDILG